MKAFCAQLRNRFTRRFFFRVGYAEQPGKATVNRHQHHRLAFAAQRISLFAQFGIHCDAELFDQL